MKRARFTEEQIIGVLRPHSALGYQPPAVYAANLTATGDRRGNPDQLCRRLLLNPNLKAYELPRL